VYPRPKTQCSILVNYVYFSEFPLDFSESLLERGPSGLFTLRIGSSIAADSLPANSVLGCEVTLPGTHFTTTEELIHRPTASKSFISTINYIFNSGFSSGFYLCCLALESGLYSGSSSSVVIWVVI
jgi:hypothetical protein